MEECFTKLHVLDFPLCTTRSTSRCSFPSFLTLCPSVFCPFSNMYIFFDIPIYKIYRTSEILSLMYQVEVKTKNIFWVAYAPLDAAYFCGIFFSSYFPFGLYLFRGWHSESLYRFCDSPDDLALGFTPDALCDATVTIYPGLGPALLNTNLCSLMAVFFVWHFPYLIIPKLILQKSVAMFKQFSYL